MEISYMILIVGGTFQGKKAFAEKLLNEKREDFTDGTSCAFSDIYHAKVLFHFHEYIRRMLEQEMSVQDLAEQLWMKNPDLVLISNELGYGVVPMDVFDRNYRETTGRVCTEIASEADAVYRESAVSEQKSNDAASWRMAEVHRRTGHCDACCASL